MRKQYLYTFVIITFSSGGFFLSLFLIQFVPFVVVRSSAKLRKQQQQKRHKADQETNKRQVEVLRDGQWLWLTWQQINVGDVVRVRAGAFFPADLLLISSRYN